MPRKHWKPGPSGALGAVQNHCDVHKIIVGVDYGTTYTGVGFVTTAKNHIDDIVVITSWPGTGRHSETVFKVPSRLAYPSENYRIQDVKWGFQVESGMTSYSWTKLLLDNNASRAEYDDETLTIQEAAGMPILRLPAGKSATDVVADFLTTIYKHTMGILEKQISEETLSITPLEFWFTMPAIWSDEAQDAIREAAKRAGFASRPGDQLFMIAEPEAAAIAALKRSTSDGSLVCPTEERSVGSTTIDREFYKLMSERFGDAFKNLPLKRRGPGSDFMRAFEQIKEDLASSDYREEVYELPLDMSLAEPDPRYFDDDERLVKISKHDLCALFDPVVEKIKALVKQQILAANHHAGKSVIKVYWCLKGVSRNSQAAIVKGAVLRGLEGVRPKTRRCRRHYGIAFCLPFREGIDSEENAFVCDLDGIKYTRNRVKWMIHKVLNPSRFLKRFSSTFATPTMRIILTNTHIGVVFVGRIVADISQVDPALVHSKINHAGIVVYWLSSTVVMRFGAKEGVLILKSVVDGSPDGAS
ncbi:conserved hypothetical protein [Uncinocarpus reesii 1704]|uniref:Uncharacterized protein n=1 Tax=Uncinocarpus reesii (strain UAMH 1704) TaxID=336963 RepID=C4JW25_UNCRE|nr:uncharacterized protein UREG_06767 [Uncinocarpus reesii 1704]EEP81902.1 conserved hypothetical protein [Uncinocarpus reesii 1704]